MSRRWPLVAWSLAGAGFALLVFAFVKAARTGVLGDPAGSTFPDLVVPIGFLVVGGLLASRRPSNPIGWLLLSVGVIIALRAAASQYALAALRGTGDRSAAAWGVWLEEWTLIPVFPNGAILFLFLLFPTGRLAGPRWRLVGWAGGIMSAAILFIIMFEPSRMQIEPSVPAVQNPAGISWFPRLSDATGIALFGIGIALLLAAAVGLVARFRRSVGVERAQLKWLALAATATTAAMLVAALIPPLNHTDAVSNAVLIAGFGVAVPLSIGIAVTRYRLYEIDRVINRAIVYVLLTIVLGAVYAFGAVIPVVVYGGTAPPIAVAAATLLVAGLFRPVRHRIQAFIDRRFYRRRYDAQITLEAFASTLRDEVDLGALQSDLLTVVRRTVQPSHASLWLRTEGT